MCSDGKQDDNSNKFSDEPAEKLEKEGEKKAISPFVHVWSSSSYFQSFFPSPSFSHSRDSFHSKIENYAHTIYLFLWFNKDAKGRRKEECGDFQREEQCVILFDSRPGENWI